MHLLKVNILVYFDEFIQKIRIHLQAESHFESQYPLPCRKIPFGAETLCLGTLEPCSEATGQLITNLLKDGKLSGFWIVFWS